MTDLSIPLLKQHRRPVRCALWSTGRPVRCSQRPTLIIAALFKRRNAPRFHSTLYPPSASALKNQSSKIKKHIKQWRNRQAKAEEWWQTHRWPWVLVIGGTANIVAALSGLFLVVFLVVLGVAAV